MVVKPPAPNIPSRPSKPDAAPGSVAGGKDALSNAVRASAPTRSEQDEWMTRVGAARPH